MLETTWQFLVDKITGLVPVISPFWYEWLPLAALIIASCVAVGWFFKSLREVAGAIVLATITFLVGFRKGETASNEKNKKEIARLKRRPQPRQDGDPWRWPWEQS